MSGRQNRSERFRRPGGCSPFTRAPAAKASTRSATSYSMRAVLGAKSSSSALIGGLRKVFHIFPYALQHAAQAAPVGVGDAGECDLADLIGSDHEIGVKCFA